MNNISPELKVIQNRKLIVAVNVAPPMVSLESGKFGGFEIELWERLAMDLDINFEYKKTPLEEIIPLIKNEKADVGLGGITITEEREKFVDFSHSIFNSGLRILTRKSTGSSFLSTFRLIGKDIWRVILILLGFILIVAHFAWFLERGLGDFSTNYFHGIFEAIYWTVVTISTVGYGDFTLSTVLGKLLSILVIIAGLALFGGFVGRLSAISALQVRGASICGPLGLRGKRVATKKGTTAEKVLKKIGAQVHCRKNIDKCYSLLLNGEVDAVVFDSPALMYYASKKGKKDTILVGETFENQDYGIAVSYRANALREFINRRVLALKESGEYQEIYARWFRDDEES